MAKIVDLYSSVIQGGIARSNEYVVNFANFKVAEPGSSKRTLQNQLQGIIGDNIRLNYFGVGAQPESLDTSATSETSKLNFLCDEVYIPGVNYSYGTVKGIYNGNDIKYAYGKTYSDLSMTFILDRNSYPKKFFDTWMNFIADTDPSEGSKQSINSPILFKYPDDYCADIIIIKLERSNGPIVTSLDPLLQVALSPIPGANFVIQGLGSTIKTLLSNGKRISSIYVVKRAFPSAVSPIQLSNGVTNLLKLNVTFTYQRWWANHFNVQ